MQPSRSLGALACGALLVVASCGGTRAPVVLDPPGATTVASTTTLPTTRRTVTPSAGAASSTVPGPTSSTVPPPPWVDVTRNLAGVQTECGTISYVRGVPGSDRVMVGLAGVGMFAGTGVSANWEPLGTAAGSAKLQNRPNDIQFDPNNPQVFWLAGIYGPGVFRTNNGGASFTGLGDMIHAQALGVDFSDPARATLVASTHESNQTFRSTDGGRTWVDITGPLGTKGQSGDVVAVWVVDAKTFVLGTLQGSASGIYRTTDAGKTFTRVFTRPVWSNFVKTTPGGPVFALLRDGGGVARSDDGGATWTVVGGGGRLARGASNVVRLADGRLASIGQKIVVSADEGVTWKPFGTVLPFPPDGLAYSEGQKAFFVWKFDCVNDGQNSVRAGTLMRMDASSL